VIFITKAVLVIEVFLEFVPIKAKKIYQYLYCSYKRALLILWFIEFWMFGGPICMFSGLVFQKHAFCSFEINCIKLYCVYFGDPENVYIYKSISAAGKQNQKAMPSRIGKARHLGPCFFSVYNGHSL
jgi:hypothetical protein